MTDSGLRKVAAREGFLTEMGCQCHECHENWEQMPDEAQALYEQDVIRLYREEAKKLAHLPAVAGPFIDADTPLLFLQG
jgi:hypothetical protein